MNPREYFRTFRLGKLYFKFIKGTELDANGWTGETLAPLLARWGLIGLTTLQGVDERGRFTEGSQVYYELPGKLPARAELVKMVLSHNPKPPGVFQRLFRKESV